MAINIKKREKLPVIEITDPKNLKEVFTAALNAATTNNQKTQQFLKDIGVSITQPTKADNITTLNYSGITLSVKKDFGKVKVVNVTSTQLDGTNKVTTSICYGFNKNGEPIPTTALSVLNHSILTIFAQTVIPDRLSPFSQQNKINATPRTSSNPR